MRIAWHRGALLAAAALAMAGCTTVIDQAPDDTAVTEAPPEAEPAPAVAMAPPVAAQPVAIATPAVMRVGAPALAEPVPIDPSVWPWSAVGWLDAGGFGCTGTLIGPRQVLTAAHCLVNPVLGTAVWPSAVTFTSGYAHDRYVARAGGERIIIEPGYHAHAARGLTGRSNAWAILVLDRTVPVAPVTWQAMEPAQIAARLHGGTLFLAGFGEGGTHALSDLTLCQVAGPDGEPGLLLHACHLEGQAGTPLLMRSATGDWSVVMALGTLPVDAAALPAGGGSDGG